MSRRPVDQITWTRAVLLGMGITAMLLITLMWIPSHFIYFWWDRINPGQLLKNLTGYELKDTYTLVRIRDAINMGYQTTVFAVLLAGTYIYMERKRRRLGQQGTEEPKGYLSGK